MKFETYKSQFILGNGNRGQASSSPAGLEKPIPPVFGQASCSNIADLFENDMHDQVQAPIAQAEIEEVTKKNIKGQVEVNGQVEGKDEPGVKSTLIFKCLEAMEVNEVAKKKTSTKRRRCEPKSTQPEEVFGQEIAETDCKAREEDVLPKTSDADTQIKRPKVTCEEVSMMLALGSLDNIVATCTSMKTDDPYQLCHGYPLGDQNVYISIEIAKQEYAKVPFPMGEDIKTQPQKKRENRRVPVDIIDLKKSWIFDLDLHRMTSMIEIIGNYIVAYQRYLYDVLKNTKMLDTIAFVDLAMVREGCGPARSKAEHSYARFITLKPGQLFLVPYNLDAIAKYNTEKGRPSLNAVAWKNLGGVPHQPDHIQCGFYVMRFMRDIIHD